MAAPTTTPAGEQVTQVRGDLSQTAFAERCGLSQAYISQLEKGRRTLTRAAAVNIELAMGLKPYALVRYADDLPDRLRGDFPGYLDRFALVCRLPTARTMPSWTLSPAAA